MVDEQCIHCYALERDKRFHGGEHWGKGAPRKLMSEAYWKQPLKWHRDATARNGESKAEMWEYARPRVFCASLADWLDEEWPIEVLARLLDTIRLTPNLDWLLLTKRPQNWYGRMVDALKWIEGPHAENDFPQTELGSWVNEWTRTDGEGAPANIWIGTSVGTQKSADTRIPELLKIPARVRFLSCEPLLGPVSLDLTRWFDANAPMNRQPALKIDWVICGGESGPKARAMDLTWARSLRDQCEAAGVPFFMKQLGGVRDSRHQLGDMPEDLRLRQFPSP